MTTTLTTVDASLLRACIGRPTACADARTMLACRQLVQRGFMAIERRVLIDGSGIAGIYLYFQTTADGRAELAKVGRA